GRTAVLFSDPAAPMIADAIGLALDRADAPAGTLSVVHDDGDDALRAAVDTGAVAHLRASGAPSRIRRLERMLVAAGPDRSPPAHLKLLRARCTLVRSSEDPAQRAAEIVAASLGRSSSLSGQLPGRIARAVCAERSISRFTECLLAELRRNPDVRDPVPLVDRDGDDHLRRVRVLGLDEGATLIFDGEDLLALRAAEADPARSLAAGAEAILAPTVFTNVEERMRLAPPGRPVPLLCLLRVRSDEQGAA